eukprot:CAMPEP_0180827086 /NCGR_PEP_ID=MMETSP1038_2-20121128/73931_1 /TAXON_ID=632150 /ORGANISM="Azadinium spinosum, Strain 3D9" /LENGTH=30 /DNA_ID= /DNA_START= /DNA_END= /DNA_ORIENTATION=
MAPASISKPGTWKTRQLSHELASERSGASA